MKEMLFQGGITGKIFFVTQPWLGDIAYVSVQKYSPNFYQPNVGMSVL